MYIPIVIYLMFGTLSAKNIKICTWNVEVCSLNMHSTVCFPY